MLCCDVAANHKTASQFRPTKAQRQHHTCIFDIQFQDKVAFTPNPALPWKPTNEKLNLQKSAAIVVAICCQKSRGPHWKGMGKLPRFHSSTRYGVNSPLKHRCKTNQMVAQMGGYAEACGERCYVTAQMMQGYKFASRRSGVLIPAWAYLAVFCI